VTIKYVSFIMRADNRGEGGSLALLALIIRKTRGHKATAIVAVLGVFAAALFYGDCMLTPAISVLSAVEGLQVAEPELAHYVIPLTIVILIGLFALQRFGTAIVGASFGPIMIIWFMTLAVVGVSQIILRPEVLLALNPVYAAKFMMLDGWTAFLTLGSVFLAVTGAETLYADMGHFGRKPINRAWIWLVMPALLLNYFGQGALILQDGEAVANPFFLMVPEWARMPMVILATLATVIASQAVISGAFSVTQQAIQLGYLPRMRIVHTSGFAQGQIYMPLVNWGLLVFVVLLVAGFQSSTHLAAAYGVAVSGTMITSTIMLGFVMVMIWRINLFATAAILGVFLAIDLVFFTANVTKITHGGWFPLAVAAVTFVMLTTWKRGRQLLMDKLTEDSMPVETFLKSLSDRAHRVTGTAVYMTGNTDGIPHALLHNLKHNKVIHERVVLLTVLTEDTPTVPAEERIDAQPLGGRLYRAVVRYGFMESPDVPAALSASKQFPFDAMDTSFFLNRETLVPSVKPGMARWREHLFAWMSRNATSAMDFFRLPCNRVVELGTQVEI